MIAEDGLERAAALAAHYLPHADPDDPETLGRALWLDEHFWENMSAAVQNAIARAFRK